MTNDTLNNEINSMFSNRLIDLMYQKNLNSYSLSKVLDIPRSTIGGWEQGLAIPNTERLVKLADFFGVTTDYLLGRTDCKKSIKILTSEGEKIINLDEFTEDQQKLLKSMISQFNK